MDVQAEVMVIVVMVCEADGVLVASCGVWHWDLWTIPDDNFST